MQSKGGRTRSVLSRQGDQRLGLLEKHKDYVLRAKDSHKKEGAIQRLRKDVHPRRASVDENSGHQIRATKAQIEKKKADSLRAVLHCTTRAPAGRHIYFAEHREEGKEMRPTQSRQVDGVDETHHPRNIKTARESAYRQLNMRSERADKLKSIVSTMMIQKEPMGKGWKRKVRDDEVVSSAEGPLYKWLQERKKNGGATLELLRLLQIALVGAAANMRFGFLY